VLKNKKKELQIIMLKFKKKLNNMKKIKRRLRRNKQKMKLG